MGNSTFRVRGRTGYLAGFTLSELLTVIAIIALMLAMLLPAINKSVAAAQLVNCQSNLRQLGMAVQMYANDNNQWLPFCNYAPTQVFSNASVGWLFATPLSATPSQDDVKLGVLYPYLSSTRVYHCPVHDAADSGMFGVAKTNNLTSYMMNMEVNAGGAVASPAAPPTNLPTAFIFKIGRFLPDDLIIWEADERSSIAWNDGCTSPTESYNPNLAISKGSGARHGGRLSLLSMDGHVEAMTTADYWTLASSLLKDRLWCRPDTANGR